MFVMGCKGRSWRASVLTSPAVVLPWWWYYARRAIVMESIGNSMEVTMAVHGVGIA